MVDVPQTDTSSLIVGKPYLIGVCEVAGDLNGSSAPAAKWRGLVFSMWQGPTIRIVVERWA
jgi:hypothetical protein